MARHPARRRRRARSTTGRSQRGFDRYYGTIDGAGSFYDPSSLVRDNTMISPFADPEYKPRDVLLHRRHHRPRRPVHRRARARTTPDKPFFLYVAYTAAHWPMHALPEDIAKYKGKYDGGYEPIRKARFEKAAKLGLIDPKQALSPAGRRLGQGRRTRRGRRAAWRSTRRWSTAWTRASAGSSPS